MSIAGPEVTGKKTGDAGTIAPVCYRINDACKLLSISRSHLYDLVAEGQVRLVKIGNRSLVPASEIARLSGMEGHN
jgi:excisionase family DNA binding protein